jgi:hypothetical protein
MAKMATVPVRRGYWGNKIGKVHTVRRPSGSEAQLGGTVGGEREG